MGGMSSIIGAAGMGVTGFIQMGIGVNQYKKGKKILEAIPMQDASSLDYLDQIRRKRIASGAGTGTKYSVMKQIIQSNLSDQLSGISSQGAGGGSTLAAMTYAGQRGGVLTNQLLASMSDDEQKWMGVELGLQQHLAQRELELRLARASTMMGFGADMISSGTSNIAGSFATLAGSDYTPSEQSGDASDLSGVSGGKGKKGSAEFASYSSGEDTTQQVTDNEAGINYQGGGYSW